jgi:hypothetical protein
MMSNTQEEGNEPIRRGPGRPRLENTMTPMWKEIMLDAGREGKHITEVLTLLGISWNGHYALLERSKEYSQTYSEFLKLAETWWYNRAHNSMMEDNGMGFNTKLWETIMKNRFKENWKSERFIDLSSKGEKIEPSKTPITIEIVKKNTDDLTE